SGGFFFCSTPAAHPHNAKAVNSLLGLYKPYSGIPQSIMRSFLLLITLICTSQLVFAQKGLTGLWSGVLSNDSTTIRKDQGFEIALTQYKEKVYGYTRSSFIVNDTLF